MSFRHMEDDKDSIGNRRETLVRLAGVQAREVKDDGSKRDREQPGRPPPTPAPSGHAGRKFYKKKTGFTNYYFNELERDRVLAGLDTLGKYDKKNGPWTLGGEIERPIKNPFSVVIDDKQVTLKLGDKDTVIEPLKAGETPENLSTPTGSGGLAMALYHWRRFLVQRTTGFDAAFFYAGQEPYYPTARAKEMILTDVIQTEYAATTCKWFFEIKTGKLLGVECWLLPDTDPCELTFSDYQAREGVQFPSRLTIRHADREFGYYRMDKVTFASVPVVEEKKK